MKYDCNIIWSVVSDMASSVNTSLAHDHEWLLIHIADSDHMDTPQYNVNNPDCVICITIFRLFPQLSFQNFSTGCLGNLFNKLHTSSKLFMRRNLVSNKINDLFLCDVSLSDNESFRKLSSLIVRDTNHCDIQNVWMCVEKSFQFCWRDLDMHWSYDHHWFATTDNQSQKLCVVNNKL